MKIRKASSKKKANLNPDEPATPKQLAFLKKLGFNVTANLTKQQASKLIKRGLERRAEYAALGWEDVKG